MTVLCNLSVDFVSNDNFSFQVESAIENDLKSSDRRKKRTMALRSRLDLSQTLKKIQNCVLNVYLT